MVWVGNKIAMGKLWRAGTSYSIKQVLCKGRDLQEVKELARWKSKGRVDQEERIGGVQTQAGACMPT